MIHIHQPTRSVRIKRKLRRAHVALVGGLRRGWRANLKDIHELPETREPELLGEKAP